MSITPLEAFGKNGAQRLSWVPACSSRYWSVKRASTATQSLDSRVVRVT